MLTEFEMEVLRDIAVWEMKRCGYNNEDDESINRWISIHDMLGTASTVHLYKQYWEEKLGA